MGEGGDFQIDTGFKGNHITNSGTTHTSRSQQAAPTHRVDGVGVGVWVWVGGGDLLIQSSLLGDPSSYLLLYSWSHKPSEGGKTPLYPLCRLAKKKKKNPTTENIPEKREGSRSKAQRKRGENVSVRH